VSSHRRYATRSQILRWLCPVCGAKPDEKCRRPELASHRERMWLAQGYTLKQIEYMTGGPPAVMEAGPEASRGDG